MSTEPAEAGRFVDTCDPKGAACSPTTAAEGGGLVPLDRCAYALDESTSLLQKSAILAALAKIAIPVTVGDLLSDTNRIATATTTIPGSPGGVKIGVRWNDEDEASTSWIPQGISGSADAEPSGLVEGKRVVLVSWYDSSAEARGVRIAFVDLTDPKAPVYRFALLVVPSGTAAAPSFTSVGSLHAGGIAWFGKYLYVADTKNGLRVFDMSQIFRVLVDTDVIGCDATSCRASQYRYVIPQIGTYTVRSPCAPIFSFVGLDRSATPPSLVTGEYCSTTACSAPLAGRILHFPLDPATGLLRSAATYATEAFLMGEKQVQGGLSYQGTHYLSSSAPAASGGVLCRATTGKSVTSKWIDAPEDLMVDGPNGLLFTLSEGVDARYVVGLSLASYPAP